MAFDLVVVPLDFAVCHLPPGSALPGWLGNASWHSVTRTTDEVSIVCPSALVPDRIDARGPFAAFRVAGMLDPSLVGVLAGLLRPLAEAAIPVFVISTYDTDYILVAKNQLAAASAALIQAGQHIEV